MSASLVGSEMCIRDSSERLTHCCMFGSADCGLRQIGALTKLEQIAWPVSYTHLTLPTICSV
eukprot:5949597-Alexandrium_andersonii.AAC.1